MAIKFKQLEDSYKTEIFKDKLFVGHVDYDIYSKKWTIHPCFSVPYAFNGSKEEKFFSSYEAGKELIKLYEFCYPETEEDFDEYQLGMNLEDILIYLKTRD